MASEPVASSIPPVRKRVVSIQRQEHRSSCQFADGTKFVLPHVLYPFVTVGDEITFPIPVADAAGAEIYITKNGSSENNRFLYHAPIGYVSQPRQDKRNQYYVSAEVRRGSLGIGSIFLPCEVLREYFYRLPQAADSVDHPALYAVLRIPASASPSELRVAFKLRDLELQDGGSATQGAGDAGTGVQHRGSARTARLL